MSSTPQFESQLLVHLDAAFNLARWLVRDDHAAQDIVQDACLRALRYRHAFKGDHMRPWLLGIVRNSCYSWLEERKLASGFVELDDEVLQCADVGSEQGTSDPAQHVDNKRMKLKVDQALWSLPAPFREVIVLRELQGMSYDEIADIAAIPLGTVMSRLSRARAQLRAALSDVLEARHNEQ